MQHLEHFRLILRGRRSTCSTSVPFYVAGTALGAPQARFAWHGQRLQHLSFILRGRCSTCSTSREAHGSPATSEYYGRRLLLSVRCNTWSTSGSFCVAVGAAPGLFCVAGAALEHLRLVLHGRRSTGTISVAYCAAFL